MVYGAEATLPSDILHYAPRIAAYDEDDAEEYRGLDVDLLEEERVLACQRSAIYQQKLRSYHSRRASDLTLHMWHTHNPMVKLSEPMD